MQGFDEEVAALDEQGLLRKPRVLTREAGSSVTVDGRSAVLFCSNDYLGLSGHPRLREAASRAAVEHGVGSGASRLIAGTTRLHVELESRLGAFLGTEAALLFSTGYHANIGAVSALVGPGDVVFSDALNHASIIDGCRLSGAGIHVYPHQDLDALEGLLCRCRGGGLRGRSGRAMIVTDALFSMEGDLAPLREIRGLADRFEALLLVDEAHSLGVLGPEGRGLAAELRVRPDVLVGTFGKALGVFGAFVAGSEDLRRLLVSKARSFVFTTAPPPPVVAACQVALDLALAADDRRETLGRLRDRLCAPLLGAGILAASPRGPIVPLVVGAPERAMWLSDALLERGQFVQGIRPPTVPEGTSRLRVALMATHTAEQVDALATNLCELLQ